MGNTAGSKLKDVIDANSTVLSLPTGGLKMSEQEVKQLWDMYDRDGSGELDGEEVDKFILDLLNGLEKREIEVLHQLFDDKRYLASQTKDIKTLYTKLKNNKRKFLEQIDKNSDGMIQYQEFVHYLNNFRVSELKSVASK